MEFGSTLTTGTLISTSQNTTLTIQGTRRINFIKLSSSSVSSLKQIQIKNADQTETYFALLIGGLIGTTASVELKTPFLADEGLSLVVASNIGVQPIFVWVSHSSNGA